jgi:NAD(P)-dependent dehydrogenase (short-subunit alcohol dehydrogenase family)
VSDLDADGAREVADEIVAAGGTAKPQQADVSAEDAFVSLREAVLAAFGRVDLVMNNVGVLTRGLPEHLPIDEWRRVLEVNLFSVVRSHAVFVPHFLKQGSGHIVNTASFAGLFTYAYDRQPYAASKAAIVQITEGLRLYLEPQGVGVTLLCPGPVRTNLSAGVRTFGPETVTRSPGAAYVAKMPDQVGVRLADAVERNEFMVYTDDKVVEELVARAGDWNGYIARKVAEISGS